MAKSLSERIAQRVSTKQPSRIGKNRISFLAIRDDVRRALEDGWPVKVIWNTLHDEGKIEFGYDAFIGYVNRFIREKKILPVKPLTEQVKVDKVAPKDKAKTDIQPKSKIEASQSIGSFNFNPKPNKEDLL
ncbi:TraK family protein [Neisseriaceae bacterium ESL0693]|nr:TraK family protein [Neisseriaceae bacterium ESL0693]